MLLGLGANYLFGFWQADPIVGFIIVFFLAGEALEILRGEEEEEEGEEGRLSILPLEFHCQTTSCCIRLTRAGRFYL